MMLKELSQTIKIVHHFFSLIFLKFFRFSVKYSGGLQHESHVVLSYLFQFQWNKINIIIIDYHFQRHNISCFLTIQL